MKEEVILWIIRWGDPYALECKAMTRSEVKRYTRGLPLLNLDKDIKVRTDKRWQHGEKRTNYGAETSTT